MSGPECCKNPPTLSSGCESSDVLQISSLNSYVNGNTDSKIAVVLISDVYDIIDEIAKEDEEKSKRHERRAVAKKERLKSCPSNLGRHKHVAPLRETDTRALRKEE
ncbi:unnamed protein product [Lactuca virosa]|uniref:Uncharacterized protein n=1 Tax=Lactuca virosa TaxID=75947 RepID=A0AAU9NAY9_9ASTR|nr:unnamed protein product [Lactuca virosa]